MSTARETKIPEALEDFLNSLTKQLSKLLTNTENYSSAFRVHNKQLTTLGDLSFQTNLNFAVWKHLKQQNQEHFTNKCDNIFDYASKLHNKTINPDTIPCLLEDDNEFNIKISKCLMIKTNCHVFLNRDHVTKQILTEILTNNTYGLYKLKPWVKITSENDTFQEISDLNLSNLRVKILHEILRNFLTFDQNLQENEVEILLTTKSSDIHDNKILCGCVLNDKGQKEEILTSTALYGEYASNMRMMFEHKYGVRNITDKPNWRQKIDKLGHAAVTFQMIQNAPQKTISLTSKHHVIKDAAFVVYNGARISRLLHRFDVEFQNDSQKKLPSLNEVDFGNLRLNEEWELIYGFLAQFPNVIKGCVCDLVEEKRLSFQKLYEFLVQFSRAFSVYYSRIKIITEAQEHLLPTLHARIYLLKSIERVLQNAMHVLNIELVNQM